MPGADDAENNAEVAFPARPSSRRSTQDEQIDLDYDEESNHGGSIEATNSVDEKPEEGPEEKEEGELEDGELSSSDEEPEKATVAVKQPISNVSPPRGKEKITVPSTAKPNETAWERGLREAREAMRRANKVREEPDFETKRLVAAPPLRRSSRNNTDSDHSPSPGPRRRNHSRSDSPRGGIPFLLDIRTSPPPRRLPPKGRDLTPVREQPYLRPIRRRSPSYGSHSRSCTPPKSPIRRRHPLDLGPQVIYPNGRPCPRRDGQDNRQRDNKRREPSPTRHRDRQDRGRSKGSQELKKTQKRLTMISTSPISSDSDDSDRKGPQRGNNGDSVSDPWARRKTTAKKRCRRSSSSSSNSDSSRSTIPGSRKKKSRSTSRSSSDSESDSDSDYEKKKKKKITKERSPPRGDISTYRIPKKSARKEEDAVEAFFSKKKSDLPAAFRKRRRDSDAGSGKKVKMEEISGSESDDSERSKSRTPPPPPPLSSSSTTTAAKNKKKAKSPSPISEDSDEETQPLPAPSSQQLDDVSPPPPAAPPSPPAAPRRSPSTDSTDLEEKQRRRKQELLAQLREVDNELAKRRSVLGT